MKKFLQLKDKSLINIDKIISILPSGWSDIPIVIENNPSIMNRRTYWSYNRKNGKIDRWQK